MATRTGINVIQTQRLRLSGSLHTALRLLRADAAGLTQYLEEQAAETPALVLTPVPPAPDEWLPRWTGILPQGGDNRAADRATAAGPSLIAHVIDMVPAKVPSGPMRRIALALVEALEPSGWLGRDLAGLARDLGVTEAEVAAVLAQLQTIEPVGLFARGLAECLALQAREAGVLDAPMQIILDNLGLLAASDWPGLCRLTGLDEPEMRRRFGIIRGFNPKPGAAFSAVHSPMREPDLTARKTAEGWQIGLNRSALPDISVTRGHAGEAQANTLRRMVESRNQTLLLVARHVLSVQAAALEAGPVAMKPLTMQAVADELRLHKSTISRVVSGTSVDTPHGTWWLRALFSPDMGADTGAGALRARLAQLVAAEDRNRPLSDEALASALSDGRVAVARRTVAKYRTALRIPPAHRRRLR